MPSSIYKLSIFSWIERDIIDKIILNCPEKEYKEWEIIMFEWEETNHEWYIIKKWSVNISINWNYIAELTAGDIFGEIALLNEEPRTATVTAKSNIIVIVLSLEDLIEMINNDNNKINKEIIRRMEDNLKNH